MQASGKTLVDLENKFWQSMVDDDSDTAVSLLCEPALMVSSHGTMKFDHAAYKRMADQGSMVLKRFALSDVDVTFPNDDTAIITYQVEQAMAARGKSATTTQHMADTSVWVRKDGDWQCAMHTETPVSADKK